MKKLWIYMTGVAPFAVFANQLQSALGGPKFFVVGFVCLILVRTIAERIGK